ncbi:hypothetical protein D3C75_906170 [compost metagenome]
MTLTVIFGKPPAQQRLEMAISTAERLCQLLGQFFGGDRLAGLPQSDEDLQQAISGRVVVHIGLMLLRAWCTEFSIN